MLLFYFCVFCDLSNFSLFFQFEVYGAVTSKPKLKLKGLQLQLTLSLGCHWGLRTLRLSWSRLQGLSHPQPPPLPLAERCGAWAAGTSRLLPAHAARLHFYTGHTKEEVWRVAVRGGDNRRFLFHSNTVHLPPVGWAKPRRARGSRGCPARGGRSRVPLPRPWVRTS